MCALRFERTGSLAGLTVQEIPKPIAMWLQYERLHSPRQLTYRRAVEYVDWRTTFKKRTGKTVERNTAILELKMLSLIMGEAVRLAVLKKWFGSPGRLPPFAIWVASRAISGKGKTGVEATEPFRHTRALLARVDPYAPKVDRKLAKPLHDRLQTFQNEYKYQQWGPVRIIHNWDLLLVEQALAICLWYSDSPAHGYKLAADYCQHYDSRFVNKLEERQ
jgi:hypothetical protein